MEDTYFMDEALALAREAAADGEVLYQDGERITTETSLDLYAVWADAYTVTFDNDGKTSTVQAPTGAPIGSASVGVYPVRDAGTLPHVCRGHYQRPHPPGGLRRFRPEVRRCGFGVQSVFHGVQSSPASGKRRPGSRVRGAADGIFP